MSSINFFEIAQEVLQLRAENAQLKMELETIGAKRRDKSLNNKKAKVANSFLEIMRSSMMRLKNQEYKDARTLRKIVLNRIIEMQGSKYEFFSDFNQRLEQLLGLEPFVEQCEANDLMPNIVAQHVVMRGQATVNRVFNKGLTNVFNSSALNLMKEPIFNENDLDLEKHLDLAPDGSLSMIPLEEGKEA